MRNALTLDEYRDKLKRLHGNQYTVLGTSCYGVASRVKLRHNYCGYEWSPVADNMLNKNASCPICSKNSFTPLSYRKYVKIISGWSIIVLDDYKNFNTALHYKCLKHDYIFTMTPISFRRGNYRCKKCKYEHNSLIQRKSNSEFLEELKEAHNSKIIATDNYINTHTKIMFKCLVCKNYWKAEPNSVLRISGCPYCNNSHGEIVIKRILDRGGINYQSPKIFKDCLNIRPLHYDFYLPDCNLLLEYDGLQHYKSIEFFGGEKSFIDQQKRDAIKNKYAKDNGYILIRIPYKDTDKAINREVVQALSKYITIR